MILLIDNYDSFTYNLYQAIGQLYEDITVIRNDKLTIEQIQNMQPEAIIISPGPGYPKDAGISVAAIEKFSGIIPILGVCLGHQSIAQAFGGDIIHAKQLMHGKASTITVNNQCPVFKHLSDAITVARYHSLIVDENTLPSCLEITARDDTNQIMAIAHTSHPTYGVQFHPESILTKDGMQIIENFLYYVAKVKITPLHTEKNLLPPAQRNALKPYIFKIIEGTDLTEAEAYDGPSLIIGYAPCELHGIAKGGMNHCQDEMKKAVKAGYWNLFSFNPALKAEGKNPFTLTSKAGDGSYQEFLNNEARYTRLIKPFPERAEKLFAKSEETAKARYTHLEKLVKLYGED